MKRLCAIYIVLGLLLCSTSAVRADPVALKFTTVNPARSFLVTQYLRPWAERITAQSNGLIKIQEFDGFTLVSNLNAYDRVLSDVVQITWSNQNFAQGVFPGTEVLSLPLTAHNAEEASVALWRMYA